MDVERVRPAQDANVVAAEQVRRSCEPVLVRGRGPPLLPCSSSMRATIPSRCSRGWRGALARSSSVCERGAASTATRASAIRPQHIGRPRRHGPKMKCADPRTWPEPSAEHRCEDAGYGAVRVRAWAELHPKVDNHAGKGTRGPLPIVVGTLILVEVERLPRGERRREPRVLWLWWHGPEGTAPDLRSPLALLRQALRPGAHLPLPQAEHGMDHPSGSPPRAGRPVELAGGGRLHAAKVGARACCGPEAAVGAPLRCGSADARAGPSGGFVAFGGDGHAGEGAETLR